MGRGDGEGGNGKGEMGRGQQEGGDGEGHKDGWGRRLSCKQKARGEGISQMDMMKSLECPGGMRLQFFLTLFTRATPGTPASLY